ncbi:hypothetical protein [Acinetobacter sp. 226]|uniref:hypothetical protein n=1 Tax=Acinetobacter sp. 226 TaxID=3114699 RepID=UPI003A874715
MSEIKQVWGIIKDYKCADLKMVQDPALAVFQHQQAIIDEHTEVIKIQDADLRKYEKQIESLKAQLNNMEACYIEKKKECEELQGKVSEALEEIQRALNCCESTETACVLGELVKVLRGES